jgi:hypothetical protein
MKEYGLRLGNVRNPQTLDNIQLNWGVWHFNKSKYGEEADS